MEEAKEIAALLREELRPFTPTEIRAAIRERGLNPEAKVDALVQEVYEEGVKWTAEALESFWEELLLASSLGEGTGVGGEWRPGGPAGGKEIWIDEVDSLQAMFGIEESLRRGATVRMSCVFDEEDEEGKVLVEVTEEGKRGRRLQVTFFLPEPPPFDMEFHLKAQTGFVDFASRFQAVNGRIYFMTFNSGHLEEALKIARHLRLGFQAMGIDGLEGAIEALQGLKEYEARLQGPYALASAKRYTLAGTERFWFLYRGPLLGAPELDEKLVLGKPVALSFPGDVEVSFRASGFWEREVRLGFLSVRLGEETLRFENPSWFFDGIFSRNPVLGAIQAGLREELRRMEEGERRSPLSGASPQALALVRVLAQHENPFDILAEGRLRPHVTAELFADL
jgi:hypothetical protein